MLCDDMLSVNCLVDGVSMKATTVATAMAAECPQCLASMGFSAVPNEALMRVSITSTEYISSSVRWTK